MQADQKDFRQSIGNLVDAISAVATATDCLKDAAIGRAADVVNGRTLLKQATLDLDQMQDVLDSVRERMSGALALLEYQDREPKLRPEPQPVLELPGRSVLAPLAAGDAPQPPTATPLPVIDGWGRDGEQLQAGQDWPSATWEADDEDAIVQASLRRKSKRPKKIAIDK